jgi:hypothetical protein
MDAARQSNVMRARGPGLIAVPKTVTDLVALQSRDHHVRVGNDVMDLVLTARSRITHRVVVRHLSGDARF